MKTVCCFGGFLCQLLIIGQVIVLYIGEGGGHLLDVEHLRSPLIARPLTGSQLRLNIHRQTDFPFRVPGAFFFALNGGQNILQVVAVPPSVEAHRRVTRSCLCPVSRKLVPPPRTVLTSHPAHFIRLRNSSRSAGHSASAVSMARCSRS